MNVIVGRRYRATRSISTQGVSSLEYEGEVFLLGNTMYLGQPGTWRVQFTYLLNNDFLIELIDD